MALPEHSEPHASSTASPNVRPPDGTPPGLNASATLQSRTAMQRPVSSSRISPMFPGASALKVAEALSQA